MSRSSRKRAAYFHALHTTRYSYCLHYDVLLSTYSVQELVHQKREAAGDGDAQTKAAQLASLVETGSLAALQVAASPMPGTSFAGGAGDTK